MNSSSLLFATPDLPGIASQMPGLVTVFEAYQVSISRALSLFIQLSLPSMQFWLLPDPLRLVKRIAASLYSDAARN